MIVKCLFNETPKIVETEYLNHISNYLHLSQLNLNVGREYVVYGMIFREGFPWYYVCEEESDEYPRPHFAGFFQIKDFRLPSCWKLSWSSKIISPAYLLPDEWADDTSFYERLIDGNEFEEEVFRRIKLSIDKEAKI